MRMGSLGASLVVVATLAAPAVAADPPALARAKAALEANRNDAHREKMRVVWPEGIETTPPEGAEIVVIEGYISYVLTRLVWREGRVEARAVSVSRTWFYNDKGESFGAYEFDVTPEAFAQAWLAARHVSRATELRIVPKPSRDGLEIGPFRGWSVSHESSEYVRLVAPGSVGPLHASDPRGGQEDEEGLPDWDRVVARSVFDAIDPRKLIHDSRKTDLAPMASFALETVREATPRLDLGYRGEHHLLVEVCLRLLGEAGSEGESLVAIDDLERAIDARSERESGVSAERDLRKEIDLARTRLRLRQVWSDEAAKEALARGPASRNAENDLRAWIRRQFEARSPVAYLELLLDDPERTAKHGAEFGRVAGSVKAPVPARFRVGLDRALDLPDPDARVHAARLLLSIDSEHARALDVLEEAARDRFIAGPAEIDDRGWSRAVAVRELCARGRLAPDAARKWLAASPPDHALVVDALIALLESSGAPVPREERVEIWRRVLQTAATNGAVRAAQALLDLRDVASRERLVETLDRVDALLKRDDDATATLRKDVAALRARIASEMPPPPTPPK